MNTFERDLADLRVAGTDAGISVRGLADVNTACTAWLVKRGLHSASYSYGRPGVIDYRQRMSNGKGRKKFIATGGEQGGLGE